MEVSEDKWITEAINNVDKYKDRGGVDMGDEPQLLQGTQLFNTIGFAMSLQFRDPNLWTERERKMAEQNNLCFYFDEAKKAIDVIAEQIYSACNNNTNVYVTILPIELYLNGMLYEVPLFRVKGNRHSSYKFVDNMGRIYDDMSDWESNNKLPAAKVLYPANGVLSCKYECNYSRCYSGETPAASVGATVLKVADITVGVTGIIGSVGACFLTGGLAIPFVAAGIGSAIYGSTRSGVQLYDRGAHGESINPFTDINASMLWLGIAASAVSFGAMGATARFTYLARVGKEISTAFKVTVNIVNGTTLTLNTTAILLSTIVMIKNRDQLTAADILLQCMNIAFWAKGIYQYKTAGQLIKLTQNEAIGRINSNLSPENQVRLKVIRNATSDRDVLKLFYEASKQKINFNNIVDTFHAYEAIAADLNGKPPILTPNGNLKFANGHEISAATVHNLPIPARQAMFLAMDGIPKNLQSVFSEFRNMVNNDAKLFSTLTKLSLENQITPGRMMNDILKMFQYFKASNGNFETPWRFEGSNLIVGHGNAFNLPQLSSLPPNFGQIIAIHISPLSLEHSRSLSLIRNNLNNDAQLFNWVNHVHQNHRIRGIDSLVQLRAYGLFTICPVTSLNVNNGVGVIELNKTLRISILKLASKDMDFTTPETLTLPQKIEKVLSSISLVKCQQDLTAQKETNKLLVTTLRLRFEFQRNHATSWFSSLCKDLRILKNPLPGEMDRLYMVKNTLAPGGGTKWFTRGSLAFAERMKPSNIGQLAAYCEFGFCYANDLKHQMKNRGQAIPTQKLADTIFGIKEGLTDAKFSLMNAKYNELKAVAVKNNMVGPITCDVSPLSDTQLIKLIRGSDMKFATNESAAYHILKHGGDFGELTEYVNNANSVIRDNTGDANRPPVVTLSQEGDTKSIIFDNNSTNSRVKGKAICAYRNGKLMLCTFM